MSQYIINETSALVQVKAWCRLSQISHGCLIWPATELLVLGLTETKNKEPSKHCIIGHLCWESTSFRWIILTKTDSVDHVSLTLKRYKFHQRLIFQKEIRSKVKNDFI